GRESFRGSGLCIIPLPLFEQLARLFEVAVGVGSLVRKGGHRQNNCEPHRPARHHQSECITCDPLACPSQLRLTAAARRKLSGSDKLAVAEYQTRKLDG